MLRLFIILIVLGLAGCSTMTGGPSPAELERWATNKLELQIEKMQAQRAREQAVEAIAKQGEHGAFAAAMVLLSEGRADNRTQAEIPPWAGRKGIMDYLIPILGLGVQVHGINANRDISIASSNNSRDVSVASYSALSSVAGMIQSSNTTTYTASGDGASTGGTAAYHTEQIGPDSNNTTSGDTTTTTDRHDVTDSHNATATPTVVYPEVVNPVIWAP